VVGVAELVDPLVMPPAVRDDGRTRLDVVLDEAVEGRLVRLLDSPHSHPAGALVPDLDSEHDHRLPGGAAAAGPAPLHPAEVGLVDLNIALQLVAARD